MDQNGGSSRRSDRQPGDPAADPGKSPSSSAILASDISYRNRLRAGCIDYNRQHTGALSFRSGVSVPPATSSWTSPTSDRPSQTGSIPLSRRTAAVERGGYGSGGGLHRSNSNLELDRYGDVEMAPAAGTGALRREFGSTNSLDVVDCFTTKIRNFRSNIENLDATPPTMPHQSSHPDVHTSRSLDDAGGTTFSSDVRAAQSTIDYPVSNGSIPADSGPSFTSRSPQTSQSQRSKTERRRGGKTASNPLEGSGAGGNTGGGSLLLRKLRGVKSDPSTDVSSVDCAADGNPKLEERQRRKAFTHFDCQSIGVNLSDAIKRRAMSSSCSDAGLLKRANTTTGASAASAIRGTGTSAYDPTSGTSSDDLPDFGDGKSNELIQSCSFFRNEVGGEEERMLWLCRATSESRRDPQNLKSGVDKSILAQTMPRNQMCNGISVLDSSLSCKGKPETSVLMHNNLVFEYVNQGAFYYRNFFYEYDHQNFFGIDDSLGPVAVSIRREKVCDGDRNTLGGGGGGGGGAVQTKTETNWSYQYRVIVRTSELTTLRGSILEDSIPSTTKLSNARGLLPKDVLEYVAPSLNISCLRHAVVGQKTNEQLLKLDEQQMTKTYKIGIMLCRKGQSSEEDMYNNEQATPEFNEFLDFIGSRVELKGFERYRGGLDVKTDSTGSHSLYTKLDDCEIMFHVSTMLPFTPNNRQQLLRKRHIGNDIVTIVFQEPGALPFTPKSIRSQFQHVFIVVRAHSPGSGSSTTRYSLAVSRSKNVPPFGPSFLKGVLFDKSDAFRDFLLVKAINAENAVHRSDKFIAMAIRTRQEYLKDLATKYVSTTTLDSGSRLSRFSLGSGRKKDKARLQSIPDVASKSAVVWNVTMQDFSLDCVIDCFFAVAADTIVVVEELSKEVVFMAPSRSVIGWTPFDGNSLRIFYNRGECMELFTSRVAECDEVREIVSRLEVVTNGCQTEEMTLQRNSAGQLGFHVSREGIVSDVEPHGSANLAGLRPNSRLVKICEVVTSTMTHDEMIDLLRTSRTVRLTIVPPRKDGQARRGCDDVRSVSPPSHSPPHPCSPAGLGGPGQNFRYDRGPAAVPLSPTAKSGSESQFSAGVSGWSLGASSSRTSASQNGNSGASFGTAADAGPHNSDLLDSGSNGNSATDNEGQQRAKQHIAYYPAYSQELPLTSVRSYTSNTDASSCGATPSSIHAYPPGSRPPPPSSEPAPSSLASRQSFLDNQQRFLAAGDWNRIAGGIASIPLHHEPGGGGGVGQQKVLLETRSNSNVLDAGLRSAGHGARRDDDGSTMRDDFSVGYRRQTLVSSSHADNILGGNVGPPQVALPQHRSHHDISTLQSFNDVDDPRIAKKTTMDSIMASPRLRSATIHRMVSPHKPPSSSSSSSTFQNDLMRLIDTDISDYDLHRTLSDKSGRHSGSLHNDASYYDNGLPRRGSGTNLTTISLPSSQTSSADHQHRPTPRTTIDIPGTDFRLRVNPSTVSAGHLTTAIRLPDSTSGNMDWNSLLAAATETLEGDGKGNLAQQQGSPRQHAVASLKASRSMDFGLLNLTSNSSPARDLASYHKIREPADSFCGSDGGKSELEARVADLERRLAQESQERESLENEVNSLRRENCRLQEESEAAAAKLRQFSGWFFNAIDRR